MSTLKVLGKSVKFGLLKQANWATPQPASANYKIQNWDKDVSILDGDVFIDEANESAQNGIHKESEMFVVDAVTGLAKLPFSGRVTKATLVDYFAASMFDITEAVGSPFAKTIICKGLTGPIDFKADAGIVYTLFIDNTGADDGQILENAILDNFKLTFDLNARGQLRNLQASGTWVGNNPLHEQTLSGTPVAKPTTGYFNDTDTWAASTFTINGVDYSAECIRKFELELNQSTESNCKTGSGKPDQYDVSPVWILRLFLDYSTVTEKIIKQYGQGGIVVLTYKNNVSADADGELGFVIPHAKMISEPYEYNGDFLGIVVEAELKSVGAATPLTVNFTDAIDGAF